MNDIEWADEIYSDLIMRYPSINDNRLNYWLYDNERLGVETKEGKIFLYDYLDKTIEELETDNPTNEMDWKRRFGKRLRKRMNEKGIGQEELSEITGLSKVTISSYVNGKSLPSLYSADRIAEALSISIDKLLDFPKRYY